LPQIPQSSKWPGADAPGHRWFSRNLSPWLPVSRRSGGFLLVVVDLGELRVDHVLFLAGLARRRSAGSASTWSAVTRLTFLLLLVHRLAELHRSLRQRIGLGLDRIGVVALERFLEIGNAVLDRLALGFVDLRAVLGQSLLGGVQQRLGVVLRLDLSLPLLVLFGVRPPRP
jgi:hypothetical protein